MTVIVVVIVVAISITVGDRFGLLSADVARLLFHRDGAAHAAAIKLQPNTCYFLDSTSDGVVSHSNQWIILT